MSSFRIQQRSRSGKWARSLDDWYKPPPVVLFEDGSDDDAPMSSAARKERFVVLPNPETTRKRGPGLDQAALRARAIVAAQRVARTSIKARPVKPTSGRARTQSSVAGQPSLRPPDGQGAAPRAHLAVPRKAIAESFGTFFAASRGGRTLKVRRKRALEQRHAERRRRGKFAPTREELETNRGEREAEAARLRSRQHWDLVRKLVKQHVVSRRFTQQRRQRADLEKARTVTAKWKLLTPKPATAAQRKLKEVAPKAIARLGKASLAQSGETTPSGAPLNTHSLRTSTILTHEEEVVLRSLRRHPEPALQRGQKALRKPVAESVSFLDTLRLGNSPATTGAARSLNMQAPADPAANQKSALSVLFGPSLDSLITKPTTINLQGQLCTEAYARVVTKHMHQFPALQVLDVSGNNLADSTCARLIDACQANKCPLRSLSLSKNSVQRAAAASIASLLSWTPTLTSLQLADAKMTEKEIAHLQEPLCSFDGVLSLLDLSSNAFRAVCLAPINGILRRNAPIRSLNLSWTSLGGRGMVGLGEAISINQALVSLNMDHCALGDDAMFLATALRANTTLTSLSLASCGITPGAAFVLCSTLPSNVCLRQLSLAGNPIGAFGLRGACRALHRIGHDLHGLDLTGCDFSFPLLCDRALTGHAAEQERLSVRAAQRHLLDIEEAAAQDEADGKAAPKKDKGNDEFVPTPGTARAAVHPASSVAELASVPISGARRHGQFDPAYISGVHLFHLDNPLDHAVLCELLHTAEQRRGAEFRSVWYKPSLLSTPNRAALEVRANPDFNGFVEERIARRRERHQHMPDRALSKPDGTRRSSLSGAAPAQQMHTTDMSTTSHRRHTVAETLKASELMSKFEDIDENLAESGAQMVSASDVDTSASEDEDKDSESDTSTEVDAHSRSDRPAELLPAPKRRSSVYRPRSGASARRRPIPPEQAEARSVARMHRAARKLVRQVSFANSMRFASFARPVLEAEVDWEALSEFDPSSSEDEAPPATPGILTVSDSDRSGSPTQHSRAKHLDRLGSVHSSTVAHSAQEEARTHHAKFRCRPTRYYVSLVDGPNALKGSNGGRSFRDIHGWTPPREGILGIEVEQMPMPARGSELTRTGTIQGIIRILSSIRNRGEQLRALGIVMGVLFVSSYQAGRILELFPAGDPRRPRALAFVLPRIVRGPRGMDFVLTSIDGVSPRDQRDTIRELGSLYRLVSGNPTGHYVLNLSDDTDRETARLLAAVAGAEKRVWDELLPGKTPGPDTSQHGDRTGFRNATLNYTHVHLSGSFFSALPESGVLEFDYVSLARPPPHVPSVMETILKGIIPLARDIARLESGDESVVQTKHTAAFSAMNATASLPKDAMSPARAETATFNQSSSRGERLAHLEKAMFNSQRQLYSRAALESIALSSPVGGGRRRTSSAASRKSSGDLFSALERLPSGVSADYVTTAFASGLGSVVRDDLLEKAGHSSAATDLATVSTQVVGVLKEVREGRYGTVLEQRQRGRALAIQAAVDSAALNAIDGSADYVQVPTGPHPSIIQGPPSPALVRAMRGTRDRGYEKAREEAVRQRAREELRLVLGEDAEPSTSALCKENSEKSREEQEDTTERALFASGHIVEAAKASAATRFQRSGAASKVYTIRLATGSTEERIQRDINLRLVRQFSRLHLLLSQHVYSSEQAAELIQAIPFHCVGARVEAAISLFARVVDPPLFLPSVVRVLTSAEQAAVFRRLGALNLINPLSPDASYALNLAKRDERRAAHILAQLKLRYQRSGPCWHEVNFEDIPGFQMPKRWTTERGIPDEGSLRLRFEAPIPVEAEKIQDLSALTLVGAFSDLRSSLQDDQQPGECQ